MSETMTRPISGVPTQEERDHKEGPVARSIEEQTAKVPSDVWLWAAVATMGASLIFKVANRNNESQFVGQWAAPLLLVGVYNKLVKIGGSDRLQAGRNPR